MSLDHVGQVLSNRTLIIYDLSFPILGIDASFDGNDIAGRSEWLVVTACGATTDIELSNVAVGILPKVNVDAVIDADASSGSFDKLLTECG